MIFVLSKVRVLIDLKITSIKIGKLDQNFVV